MVIEDYTERMYLQTVLKKIGFDVDSIAHSRGLDEGLLRLNPEILLMTATSHQVNGLELAREVLRRRDPPHIILILVSGSRPMEAPPNIHFIESPVAPPLLLDMISDLTSIDRELLRDKYAKLRAKAAQDPKSRELNLPDFGSEPELSKSSFAPSANLEPSSLSSEDRAQRYASFLNKEKKPMRGFSVKAVEDQVKALRAAQSPETDSDLEKQRKEFVRQLFKNRS